MGLVVLLTGSLGGMKWECLAIILGTPLKEEWVSTLRILLVFTERSQRDGVKCAAHRRD